MAPTKRFGGEGLTIIIPAFNEEESLEDVFREIRAHAIELVGRLEMILVDDGSTDRTGAIADQLAARVPDTRALHHLRNRGSGQAILSGVRAASQPLLIYLPADGQFHLPDLEAYLAAARGHQIVMGARTSRDDYTALRRLSSHIFLGLCNLLFRMQFQDVNWVHLWRREVFDGLGVRSRGVFFLVEVLVKSLARGMRVTQVDSHYSGRRAGVANGARVPVILLTVSEMLRFWWRFDARRHLVSPPAVSPIASRLRDFWWPEAAGAGPAGAASPGVGTTGPEPRIQERREGRSAGPLETVSPELWELDVTADLKPPWLEEEARLVLPLGVALQSAPEGSEVLARAGERPAIVREAGRIRFLFDAERAASDRLSEAFCDTRRPWPTRLPAGYTAVLAPGVRLGLHRLWTAIGTPRAPALTWPADPSLEWLRWAVLQAAGSEGEDRVPAPLWPGGKSWALAVTHDADTEQGLERAAALSNIDLAQGVNAAWYVTAEAARALPEMMEALDAAGHEIALHGDRHDLGLPYLSEGEIEERLVRCEELIGRYRMSGYRSPGLVSTPALHRVVGRLFAYDSSVPDVDVASLRGPVRGCGSLFPFARPEGGLELPLTLPLEDKLFAMGMSPREMLGLWRQKVEFIRRVGGMALFTTHAEPHLGGAPDFLPIYSELLSGLVHEEDVWIATPRDIALWWRRRIESRTGRAPRRRRKAPVKVPRTETPEVTS